MQEAKVQIFVPGGRGPWQHGRYAWRSIQHTRKGVPFVRLEGRQFAVRARTAEERAKGGTAPWIVEGELRKGLWNSGLGSIQSSPAS